MSTGIDHLEDQIDQLAQSEKDLFAAESDRKKQLRNLKFDIEVMKVCTITYLCYSSRCLVYFQSSFVSRKVYLLNKKIKSRDY